MTIERLGRYEVLAEVGRGAMGVVYRARDPVLDRVVAVKTIIVPADAAERAEYEARFFQEAKAAGSLNHPAIVTVYDAGNAGDVAYIAMEYVDGTELRDLATGGARIPVGRALHIAAQVADGLAFAHERGIVHRDVKPANIMVTADARAKIMDFGIARVRASDVETKTGTTLGSPRYMSPEQVLGRRADARSDIFSLGVVLYELLAGAPPFSGEDVSSLMYAVVHAEAPPPSRLNPDVPPMLDLVVAKALAKVPQERYRDASELAADLRACARQLPERGARGDERTLPFAPAADAPTVMLATQAAAGHATAEPPAEPAPVRGLSRRFDSSAAMRRLAAGLPEPGVIPRARFTATARERFALGAGVIISLAAAALIALG
ncbi:MAG: serine/threonine protein kinase [Burkholderiales bacterium]|nr:serine/threonine protein kinase [Burkholderiales bacterium]